MPRHTTSENGQGRRSIGGAAVTAVVATAACLLIAAAGCGDPAGSADAQQMPPPTRRVPPPAPARQAVPDWDPPVAVASATDPAVTAPVPVAAAAPAQPASAAAPVVPSTATAALSAVNPVDAAMTTLRQARATLDLATKRCLFRVRDSRAYRDGYADYQAKHTAYLVAKDHADPTVSAEAHLASETAGRRLNTMTDAALATDADVRAAQRAVTSAADGYMRAQTELSRRRVAAAAVVAATQGKRPAGHSAQPPAGHRPPAGSDGTVTLAKG